MRMHMRFSRWKGATPPGQVTLGFDGGAGVPPTGEPSTQDNMLICGFANGSGFPAHRVAVTYRGPAAAIGLVAQLWLYDHLTLAWYEVGAPLTIVPNRVNFFDVVALSDPPQIARASLPVGGSVVATAGSIAAMLVVQDGATPNGEYVFAMGPDLTVLPL